MGEYGPFDRMVELGVLGLILYEVIVSVRRHRAEVARKRELDAILLKLSDFMVKGQVAQ